MNVLPPHNNTNGLMQNSLFLGGGGMGERIRNYEWSNTPLGPLSEWPVSLIASINIVLYSPIPMVILWGPNGIMFYNDAYSFFAGDRHPAALGTPCWEVWPEAADFWLNALSTCLQGKSLSYKDHPFQMTQGTILKNLWVDVDFSPIMDACGQPAGVLAVHSVTTQRLITEQALRESEERLKLVMDATQVAIWDWDLTTQQVKRHESIQTLFHYPPEAMGSDVAWWVDRIHPDDRDRVVQGLHGVIDSGEVHWSDEYRYLSGDGTFKIVKDRGFVIHDETGQSIRMTGLIQDITERKQMERNLKESEQYFAAIYEQASVGIVLVDSESRILKVNKFYCDIIGYTEAELQKMRISDVTYLEDPLDLEMDMRNFQRLLNKEILSYRLKKRNACKNGEIIWIDLYASPLYTVEGKLLGILGVVQDITLQKNVEAALNTAKEVAEATNQKKSDFLAMMSHELRTPLNSIIGYSQMIENGMAGPLTEKQKKYIQNVSMSGEHLLVIINDLLDVSRVEAGKMEIAKESVEISHLVDEVRNILSDLANKEKVKLLFEIQPNLGFAELDSARFKQILINLVNNAIKFNRVGGTVWVRLFRTENQQWLFGEVEDNGIGIAQNKLPELFKKFYQADNSYSRRHQGTGLGLALTKDLIELHGGEISVESQEGRGSIFMFRLPVHAK